MCQALCKFFFQLWACLFEKSLQFVVEKKKQTLNQKALTKIELQFPQCPPESNLFFPFFGRYMVTSGMDKKLKVYDIRAFKPLQSYFLPAGSSCLSLSHRGLLSAATGDIVQVFNAFTLHELWCTGSDSLPKFLNFEYDPQRYQEMWCRHTYTILNSET